MRTILALLLLFSSSLSADELVYQRSIKLPKLKGPLSYTQQTFHNSRGPLTVRPSTGGLIIRGHGNYNDCLEVTVPAVDGATASVVGDWFNPTGGIDVAERARTGSWYYLRGMVCTDEDNIRCCLSKWYAVAPGTEFPFITHDMVKRSSHGPWNGGQNALRLGEYITRLSPELQAHSGFRYVGGATSQEGTAGTADGPAIYFFDIPPPSTVGYSTFASTLVYSFDDPACYPGWYSSHQVNSIHCLPHSVIWIGRESYTDEVDFIPILSASGSWMMTPAKWYGEATMVFHRTDGTPFTVVDESTPGKGQHGDKQRCRVISLQNSRIIAGNIVPADFTQFYLPECVGASKYFTGTYNSSRAELYVLDAKADLDQPIIRVYKVQ